MTNPTNTPNKYYFYDDASLIVYIFDEIEQGGTDMIYLGSSDNPNTKMAVAAFTQQGKVKSGYTIRQMA